MDHLGPKQAYEFLHKNPDALLFGEKGIYTPFLQLGLGVGF